MPKPPTRTAPDARLADVGFPSLDDVRMWPGHDVALGSATVHVRSTPATSPDAEPAVFVHGLGGSAPNWTDFAGLLRDRFAVDSLDLPGHGRSGPAQRDDYSLRTFADVVIDYLTTSGRGPVHLAGNSMGGAVSILVAARRPDLVRTLTLISPAVPDNRPRVYPLRHDWRMALLAFPFLGGVAMKRMAGLPARTRAKATIAMCFADPDAYPAARLDEAVDEVEARADMPWASTAFLRSLRGLMRSQFFQGRSAWRTMRAITAPTLVVWGDTDRLVAPDLAPYVAAAIPNSRLLVLEHVGHTAMMEDPVSTARAMLALVEDAAAVRS